MSLKNFHIVFIVAAVLLAVFCAGQAFVSFRAGGSVLMAAASGGALAAAAVLVQYEGRFIRRCRKEGIQ
jgi:hypothetical protein